MRIVSLLVGLLWAPAAMLHGRPAHADLAPPSFGVHRNKPTPPDRGAPYTISPHPFTVDAGLDPAPSASAPPPPSAEPLPPPPAPPAPKGCSHGPAPGGHGGLLALLALAAACRRGGPARCRPARA